MVHRILLVMLPERQSRLAQFVAENDVEMFRASGIDEAQRALAGERHYDLVFVDSDLPDGTWRDLLQFLVASELPCEMVVCARHGDEQLWAEVIQCGAFDLVPEPFERQEVLRIMHSALESHYMQRFGHSLPMSAC